MTAGSGTNKQNVGVLDLLNSLWHTGVQPQWDITSIAFLNTSRHFVLHCINPSQNTMLFPKNINRIGM